MKKQKRKPSLRRPPIARMSRIYAAIDSGAYPNCTTLAEGLEASPKTILADLDFMRDMLCLPIYYNCVEHGFFFSHDPATRKRSDIDPLPILGIRRKEVQP